MFMSVMFCRHLLVVLVFLSKSLQFSGCVHFLPMRISVVKPNHPLFKTTITPYCPTGGDSAQNDRILPSPTEDNRWWRGCWGIWGKTCFEHEVSLSLELLDLSVLNFLNNNDWGMSCRYQLIFLQYEILSKQQFLLESRCTLSKFSNRNLDHSVLNQLKHYSCCSVLNWFEPFPLQTFHFCF